MNMPTVGLGFYFEDLPLGRQFKTIGRTITETDITNFCNATGNTEVLFTNLVFLAEESDLKGRPVPAPLTYCMSEGLLVQATMQHTGFAFLHMELDVEVIESRRSKSRPNRGLVRTRNKVVNQHGVAVITYTPLRMIKCKGDASHD